MGLEDNPDIAHTRKMPAGSFVCPLSPLHVCPKLNTPEVMGSIAEVDWACVDSMFESWRRWNAKREAGSE
jgi:hypothetical protein